ncbi:MAG TPA: YajD family HNH nuclease [Thiohalobacter sp.]|nr:YajD family HNH nuclease [Thiohalobacter sp.]
MSSRKPGPDSDRLDRVVAEAHRYRDQREKDYREQALKLYPWVCGRCGRGFDRSNLRELTVHHRDHNHDNNPADGSNWELLCLYCHDNEHQKQLEAAMGGAVGKDDESGQGARHNPFADLKSLLDRK